MSAGLLIAAPASGSGKTLVTLALLRHFRDAGLAVASVKVGPDYIDPAFHAAASGRSCLNMDSWAMRPATLAGLAGRIEAEADLVLGEGVMGLFDGAPDGRGSTADLAAVAGWPVVLVIDVKGMAASAAALLQGFAGHRPDVALAGVIFNRVGSDRHRRLLEAACAPQGIPVLGALPHHPDLVLPDRHLGLVQAAEHPDLEGFLERAAGWAGAHIDGDALRRLAKASSFGGTGGDAPLPPLGQRIAVVLEGWREAGATLDFFSPLADEAPDPAADAVYLPGGYPELHAGKLAGNGRFLAGLRDAAERGAVVYGECGGYMVLGEALVDGAGIEHGMAGLLPLRSSFAARRMTLGYRRLRLAEAGPLGPAGAGFRGHEFHFCSPEGPEGDPPFFHCRDAADDALGGAGARAGTVMGSFIHLIDREEI
jgi:cobyrinic acid a,c-diamide synthase